ncbi:hypothetical protein M9H77_12282 [Catharanthus roseus]|uniref:Uncharacterized protein n=1 Tax=Catharanthus roseus TaxID=4058 RepID=A0ACC0BH54_CATRO|nr:hypothetical protein M9H77_12282 [Catharanthus roseus]
MAVQIHMVHRAQGVRQMGLEGRSRSKRYGRWLGRRLGFTCTMMETRYLSKGLRRPKQGHSSANNSFSILENSPADLDQIQLPKSKAEAQESFKPSLDPNKLS